MMTDGSWVAMKRTGVLLYRLEIYFMIRLIKTKNILKIRNGKELFTGSDYKKVTLSLVCVIEIKEV